MKEQAIDFAKKHQSVTYLVFSNDDAALAGYFTLAIKPITVHTEGPDMSKSMQRRLARVSEFDEENGAYMLSAYLIAKLGKKLQRQGKLKDYRATVITGCNGYHQGNTAYGGWNGRFTVCR